MPPRRDPTTYIYATVLGGPDKLANGRFVLADLRTIEQEEFWQDKQNIRCIVNCIGKRYGKDEVKYPAATSQVHYVESRNPARLPDTFTHSCKAVEETLAQGYDVLVHCRETFHRGPAVWAGYQARLCGQDYQVISCT
jgi:hypothetical protein